MIKIEYSIIAVKYNDIEVMTLLFDKYGIDCLVNNNNQNVLHYACAYLQIEQTLISFMHDIFGEDIFIKFLRMKDDRDMTPLDYAYDINNKNAIQYIYNTIGHDIFMDITFSNTNKSNKNEKLVRNFFVMPELFKSYLLNDFVELTLSDFIEIISLIHDMDYNLHNTLNDFDSFMQIAQIYPVYDINKDMTFSKHKNFVEYYKIANAESTLLKNHLYDSIFSIDINNVNVVTDDDSKKKICNFLCNMSSSVINKFIEFMSSDMINNMIDIDTVIDLLVNSIMKKYENYEKRYPLEVDISQREKKIYCSLKIYSHFITETMNKIILLLYHFKMNDGYFSFDAQNESLKIFFHLIVNGKMPFEMSCIDDKVGLFPK